MEMELEEVAFSREVYERKMIRTPAALKKLEPC